VSRRRTKGDGGITQRHDHPTCPPPIDGERPDHRCRGRWQATLDVMVDGRRRRKTLYARTKAEAQTKLNKALRERDAGALVLKSMTVEAWLGRWLDRKAKPPNALKPQTMRSYRSKVDRYLIPHLGRHQLTALRAAHIEAMYDHMRSDGLAEATLRQTHAILSGALSDAIRADHLSYNPIDKTRPPGTEKKKRPQFTIDQANQVLDAAGDNPRWWLALFYGMRQGEVLGLDWSTIDFNERVMWVRETLQTDEDGHLFLGTPKTAGSVRPVPMVGQVEVRLRLLWENEGRPSAGLVFHTNGKPVQPKRDWQDWRDLIDQATAPPMAPLPYVALHAARQSAASLMEAAGIPDRLVMQILGQTQVQTTHGYQHADLDRMRQALEAAAALLRPRELN
jgi:integrase